MPNRFARGHRDRNEPQITEVLRRCNVRYALLPEGCGADILLYLGPLELVEVKNPSVPKADRELTETEKETQAYCKENQIPYHVVLTPEEMADVINQWIEKKDREGVRYE